MVRPGYGPGCSPWGPGPRGPAGQPRSGPGDGVSPRAPDPGAVGDRAGAEPRGSGPGPVRERAGQPEHPAPPVLAVLPGPAVVPAVTRRPPEPGTERGAATFPRKRPQAVGGPVGPHRGADRADRPAAGGTGPGPGQQVGRAQQETRQRPPCAAVDRGVASRGQEGRKAAARNPRQGMTEKALRQGRERERTERWPRA